MRYEELRNARDKSGAGRGKNVTEIFIRDSPRKYAVAETLETVLQGIPLFLIKLKIHIPYFAPVALLLSAFTVCKKSRQGLAVTTAKHAFGHRINMFYIQLVVSPFP